MYTNLKMLWKLENIDRLFTDTSLFYRSNTVHLPTNLNIGSEEVSLAFWLVGPVGIDDTRQGVVVVRSGFVQRMPLSDWRNVAVYFQSSGSEGNKIFPELRFSGLGFLAFEFSHQEFMDLQKKDNSLTLHLEIKISQERGVPDASPDLRLMCEEVLIDTLTPDNCLDLLINADIFKAGWRIWIQRLSCYPLLYWGGGGRSS